MFPLLDLPPEALELVLGAVDAKADQAALRLVCKRCCASVDRRVVEVFRDSRYSSEKREPVGRKELAALTSAPWRL